MFIKVWPGVAAMIRWLKLAAQKDPMRPQLTCIKVDNCMMTTTDGFRIHRWNYRNADTEASTTQDAVGLRNLYTIGDGLYKMEVWGSVLEYEPYLAPSDSVSEYPNTTKIWQTTMHKDIHFEPSFTVQLVINPRYVRDAFSVPFANGKPVNMEFTTEFLLTYPSESHNTGGIAQALIMPMRSGFEKSPPVMLQPSQNEWDRVQNFRKDWHYDG